MSEPGGGEIPSFTKISAEDIGLFFDRYLRNRACDSCGVDDWLGSDESAEGFVPAIVSLNKHGVLEPQFPIMPVVTMACQNCGFTRLYARSKIEAIIAKIKSE